MNPSVTSRLRSPAVVTFLLAPVIGELVSTSTPLPGFAVLWLPFALLYGCGALLARELAIRWRSGWVGIALLGAAYGIVEEGLVTRAFFDPTWEDLGELATFGRDGGVNWLWALQLVVYHATVSIGVTLAVVGILFPERRDRPWLGKRGLGLCGVGLGVWITAGFAFYAPAPAYLGVTALLVVLLAAAARLVRPRRRRILHAVPRPRRFFLLGAGATTAVMIVPHMLAEFPGASPSWAAAAIVGVTAGAAGLVARWSGSTPAWDDRHRLALAGGLMSLFVVLGPLLAGPVWGTPTTVAALVAARRLWRAARDRAEGSGESRHAAPR